MTIHRELLTFRMIQHTNYVSFLLVPDQYAAIHAPEQDGLSMIREQRTKIMSHSGEHGFVFDRIDLLYPAFVVLPDRYQMCTSTCLGN